MNLFVLSIETTQSRDNYVEVREKEPVPSYLPGDHLIEQISKRELIRVHCYVDANGVERNIGLSQEVQDALGIVLEVDDNMNRRMIRLGDENERNQISIANLRLKVSHYEDRTKWEIFKSIFKRKEVER